MHGYDVSHHDRKVIYYFVALIAGLLGILATGIAVSLSNAAQIAVAAPSGLMMFGLTFLAFDRWAWKLKRLFDWGAIPIPNIHGTWLAEIHSSKGGGPIVATLVIHQTYTRLKIRLNTSTSESLSHMASFAMVDPKCFRLRYEYSAEFRPTPESEVFRHYGVTALTILIGDTPSNCRGDYYTEQGRDSNGTLVLRKAADL
ncbi:MAG: hypothetical protein K0S79_195 [Nitrospira sp.]|jgi:hypothetical protein|nr:hypothetical protein [Nitrospira sp.]